MSVIEAGAPLVTLVNVFRTDPAHQQRLVDLLIQATQDTMRHLPGYLSANIHRSLDGTHVVNYAQWRSQADFLRMLQDPRVQPHMQRVREIATNEAHLYDVVFTHGGDPGQPQAR
jgi:quinol monooxygenase YgiN